MAALSTHRNLSFNVNLQALIILRVTPIQTHFNFLISFMATHPKLLRGKVAAITGGLTGIGRAIAVGFMQHGCKVAISHLDGPSEEQALKILHAELRDSVAGFINVPGDISRPESGKHLVDAAVREWGRLDILVSNAGICQFAEFLKYVAYLPYL